MSSGVIELLVLLAFVVPVCWWQFRDLEQAKKETARKREEAANQQASEAEKLKDMPAAQEPERK
jgi:hypothetical protein